MRTLILTFILIPQIGWTKINDFKSMIRENNVAQQNLHSRMKEAQGWENPSKKQAKKKQVLETTVADYTPKTKKSLLTYRKEKVDHAPSYKKQMHRVADEMSTARGEL